MEPKIFDRKFWVKVCIFLPFKLVFFPAVCHQNTNTIQYPLKSVFSRGNTTKWMNMYRYGNALHYLTWHWVFQRGYPKAEEAENLEADYPWGQIPQQSQSGADDLGIPRDSLFFCLHWSTTVGFWCWNKMTGAIAAMEYIWLSARSTYIHSPQIGTLQHTQVQVTPMSVWWTNEFCWSYLLKYGWGITYKNRNNSNAVASKLEVHLSMGDSS